MAGSREICVEMNAHMKTIRATATQAATNRSWWTTDSSGRDCMVSRWSPAERMDEITGNRERPDVREYGPAGAPNRVEVMSRRTVWTYYRTEADCKAHLEGERPASRLR
jgi:hypothetical protein